MGTLAAVLSRIQPVLVADPRELLSAVANPARGMLNREKRNKIKSMPTPAARSEEITTNKTKDMVRTPKITTYNMARKGLT